MPGDGSRTAKKLRFPFEVPDLMFEKDALVLLKVTPFQYRINKRLLSLLTGIVFPRHQFNLMSRFRQKMPGQEGQSGDQGGNYGTADNHGHQERVLLLGYDIVGKPVQGRDRSEGQSGGHQQGIIPALVLLAAEPAYDRKETEYFRQNLTGQQKQKDKQGRNQGRKRDEGTGPSKNRRG